MQCLICSILKHKMWEINLILISITTACHLAAAMLQCLATLSWPKRHKVLLFPEIIILFKTVMSSHANNTPWDSCVTWVWNNSVSNKDNWNILMQIGTLQNITYVHSECQKQCGGVLMFSGAAHSWLGCYIVPNSRPCSLQHSFVCSDTGQHQVHLEQIEINDVP